MTIMIDGIEYAKMICGECGVVHYMPEALRSECEKQGAVKSWNCPNGHTRVYRESAADILRRERDRLKQQLAEKDDEITAQRKAAETAKKQVKRLRKRADAGLCPCCNRHFTDLQRHMASKHKKLELVA